MNRQGRFFTLAFLLLFLISLNFTVEAAKFIRSGNSQTCLQYAKNSTQSCSIVTSTSCPVDRFGEISDLIKWNVISVNPAQALSNATEVFIESFDNKLCLTTQSNAGVQACPCNNDVTQRWKSNGDGSLMSSSNNGKCLIMIGDNLGLDTCQNNSTPQSWKIYNAAPNAVNVYVNKLFSGNITQLLPDTYTSNNLPKSIFTSSFSLVIPPGFIFEIDSGKANSITYDSDIAQADPISSLTSTITVKLKSGMVVYEQPGYFGDSKFFEVGASTNSTQTKAIMIGSVMVPNGVRGVLWQSASFSGRNLGLFETVANFTGVAVATNQAPVGSFDVSSASCPNECGSGGFCNGNQCVCKPGFAGPKCDKCLPEFFGPNCQACPNTCGDPTKFTCEDGLSGSGKCKCRNGFTGEKCDQCLPGFFGANCKACNCGNGVCDAQGNCSCNAGWINDPNNPNKTCSICETGFFSSGSDCKVCSPGCQSCEATTGKCTQCIAPLIFSTDDPTKCVPKPSNCLVGQYSDPTGLCQPCDTACQTCYGPGPGSCLKCQTPLNYFKGSCIAQKANDGRCNTPQQVFFVDNSQGACEACPSACSDCFIPNYTPQSPKDSVICTKCIAGFVLDNGKCVQSCPAGKFVGNDKLTCTNCNTACSTCNGPLETQCLSCSNTAFFAMNGVCSSTQCPSSYVSINTTCTTCHPDCAECSGPGVNQCTKCPSNRPVLTKDGQCVEICPMGTYLDDSGQCQKCNKDCSSCVGPRSDQCLGCSNQSNVLIGGSCSDTCPAGAKLIKSERICQSEAVNNNNNSSSNSSSNNDNSTQQGTRLEWWKILIIVLSIVIFLVGIVFLIRYCSIKRRKKETDEFKEALDENQVNKQMRSLYEIAPRLAKKNKSQKNTSLTELEKVYSTNSKELKHTDVDTAYENMRNYNGSTSETIKFPPPYDQKQGEEYWKNKKSNEHQLRREFPTTNSTNDAYIPESDYGLDIVINDFKDVKTSPQDNGGSSSSNSNSNSSSSSSSSSSIGTNWNNSKNEKKNPFWV